jgi:hypothetical protein
MRRSLRHLKLISRDAMSAGRRVPE